MHSWITLRTGLRNSSTGVPIVMITGPLVEMSSGRLVKNSRLSASALVSSGCAPFSMNGTRPDFKVASVCSLRSLTLTVSPLAANDSTSGIPTWPAPPTTVKSAVLASAVSGSDRASGGGTVGNVQRLSPNVGLHGRTVA